jgi:hypothetical protein
MEVTRRELLQTTVISSTGAAFPFQVLPVSAGFNVPLSFAWGFEDSPHMEADVMAGKLVKSMDYTMARYDVVGWEKEPEWKQYMHKGRQRYRLDCQALCASDDGIHPNYRSIL